MLDDTSLLNTVVALYPSRHFKPGGYHTPSDISNLGGFDSLPEHPPDISKLGGCHPKTGRVLTPPRGGLHKSLYTNVLLTLRAICSSECPPLFNWLLRFKDNAQFLMQIAAASPGTKGEIADTAKKFTYPIWRPSGVESKGQRSRESVELLHRSLGQQRGSLINRHLQATH